MPDSALLKVKEALDLLKKSSGSSLQNRSYLQNVYYTFADVKG